MRSNTLRAIWERSWALFWAKAIFGNKKYKPNHKTNVNLSNIEKLLSNEKNNNDDNEKITVIISISNIIPIKLKIITMAAK